MSDLASRRCEPCRSGATPLAGAEIGDLVAQIDPAWQVVDGHHLRREFRFKDFAQALAFTNRVGELAEEQFPPSGHRSALGAASRSRSGLTRWAACWRPTSSSQPSATGSTQRSDRGGRIERIGEASWILVRFEK